MLKTGPALFRALITPRSLEGRELPYTVVRTINGSLPVYKVYKSDGKIVNTVVKHVRGDLDSLRKDLAKVCESPVKIHMGSLEVRGIHTWKIKEYLESIGI
jgi:large subunit ribosomal protein L49